MGLKANELRIGNLVDYNGQVETVYAIRNRGVDFYRGKTKKSVIMQSYIWEAIKPIPLTEEWLLKLGFEKVGRNFITKDNFVIWLSLSSETYQFRLYGYGKDIEIKYVHQLQNLHFALTNKELEIKM